MMIRQRKPLGAWDYVTIGASAAVSAFAVLAFGVYAGIPMLCPDGLSSASCPLKSPKQSAAVVETAAVVAPAEVQAEPAPVEKAAEVVTVAAAEPADGAVPMRRVKALVVRPGADGSTTIVGLSAAPEAPAPSEQPVVASVDTDDVETASIVAPTPLPSDRRPEEPDTLTVTTGANVRSGPTRSAKTIFSLAAGEEVHELKKQKGWIQVRDDRDRTGWIYSDFVD